VVDHVRLFRNLPGVRWEYRVHEQILPAVRRAGGRVRWSDAVVRHTGYQDPALRGRKLERPRPQAVCGDNGDFPRFRVNRAERVGDPTTGDHGHDRQCGAVLADLAGVVAARPVHGGRDVDYVGGGADRVRVTGPQSIRLRV